MTPNYGEIICNAVDEIVTAKLQGLQYDITKLCTIVDDTYSYQGKYVVSDGTAQYEAYSTDVSLKTGNQVQVTIPNGDYTMQKTIIGRIAAADTTPFNYTSPLDTMIKITNNLFDNTKTFYGDNDGLLANGDVLLSNPIYSLSGTGDLAGYTRLGLSANFRSWLNGLDVISGSYGIKVLIYTNMTRQSGEAPENTVYELTFSSADMVGNPYQFEDYFYQEKVFDISNITNIQKIDVYFYQDSNFKDGDGELVPHTSELAGAIVDNPNNLFVDDVKIFLGYEVGAFTEETLMLYTNDSMTYRYDKKEKKDIYLRWIHKIDEKNYQILNNSDIVKDGKYELRWFKYAPGHPTIDQYAGKDWEMVQDKDFLYYLFPNEKNQNERIKVVGLIKTQNENSLDTATTYFSNILIFENEELVPDQTTLEASTALSIHCTDNTEGNYFLYNQNGKIINEGQGKGHTRRFKAMYQGAEITESLGTINWIKWYFPLNENTMLVTTEDMFLKNNGTADKKLSYQGVDYIEVERSENPVMYQDYSIDNFWNYQKSVNTVICRLSLNGIEYQAIKELRFGKAGTNGTNMTFLIDFVGNNNAIDLEEGEEHDHTATVQAKLYCDGEEQSIGFSAAMANNITWEWYQPPNEASNEDIEIQVSDNKVTALLTLKKSASSYNFSENFHILKATYSYGDQKLEAFLPIPYKKGNCAYIEGAREIIYNAQGNPQYYNDAYVPYRYNEDTGNCEEIKVEGRPIPWSISYNEKQKNEKNYMATLKEHPGRRGYQALSAGTFYVSTECDAVCVYSSGYWSQPILIMQSKYDFAMLNEWDGTFKINDNDGTILATMLSAGKKNDDNTFSGVLIGDVREGTGSENSTEALTGVYGLSRGVISYALKEDGTATFGAKGKGQIQIDGKGGTIKSGQFDDEKGGMSIDLDEGTINIKNKNNQDIIFMGNNILPSKDDTPSSKDSYNYLTIKDTSGNKLIEISDGNYYLQSSNTFTKFDLQTGSLTLSTSTSFIELTAAADKDYLFYVENAKSPLIKMGRDNYYLQSADFTGKTQKNTKIGDSIAYYYYNPNKTYQISTGNEITNEDSYEYIYVNAENKVYDKNKKEISFGQVNVYVIDNKGNEALEPRSTDEVKAAFIASLIPQMEKVSSSGLKIDLVKGSIIGYNLYLSGIKGTDTDKMFLLDSTAETTPFKIGNNFKVDWDGTVTCSKVNSLNNDGRGQYAISIGNNFYVTSGGTAGGGTWQGSSLGVAGYSQKTITSGGTTYYVLGK